MVDDTIPTETQSLFRALSERRVPQIAGFYMGASWGLIQFIEWIVERYGLSPLLPDFSLVILFSLLPSVLIVAYFHGKPGPDSWNLIEKISIPVNIIATITLLFSLFSGKDLGAATKTMLVENEHGDMVEHVVAKVVFRKKIIFFDFKNNTGNIEYDWLEEGVPFSIAIDLMQDPFVSELSSLVSNGALLNKSKKAGFPDAVDLPISLMQEISNELHYEYFVSGEIAKTENNTFLIKTILREVKTGKTVNANQVTSTDLFESIDEISSMIKIDLGIPDYHIETIRDLPVKELMSRDFSANRDFILGIKDMEQNNDYSAAAKNLAAAIKQDHSFALAHLYLGIVYANSSRSQESIASLKEALKFDYKMPDFFAFLTKDVFYVMRGEAKKRLKLLQMQAELYPEDIDSRIRLVLAYNNSNRFEDAIKEIKDIQKIASQPAVHMDDLAAIYVRIGDLPSALESYKNYANNFPQEAKSFNSLAYVYNLLGNESLARENYEKALFIESNNLTATLSLATLDLKLGQFEKATNAYLETLAQTYAPADRIRIFNAIASVKSIKGELQQALEFKEKVFEQLEIIRPPLSVTIQKLIDISIYMRAGKHEQALSILKQADATLKTPFEKLSSLGYVQYYLEIEDIEAATKQIQVVEQAAEQLDGAFSGLAYVPLIMRAAVEELKKNYPAAIESYQKYSELNPIDTDRFFRLGKIYNSAGNLEQAEHYLKQQLDAKPFSPLTHLELGKLYQKQKQWVQANKHLSVAAEVWKDADEGYKYAIETQQLLRDIASKL